MGEIVFEGGEVEGATSPPPSKSCTHRAVFISCVAGGKRTVRNPLLSADTLASIDVARAFGAEIKMSDGRFEIECSGMHPPGHELDVGNSGTTLRFASAIAACLRGRTVLDGDDSLRKRPMGKLLEALERAGAECRSADGCAPVEVSGPMSARNVRVDGGTSSQYVSAILVASPLLGEGIRVGVEGRMVSRPYVDITVDMMRRFGFGVSEEEGAYTVSRAGEGDAEYAVPADLSSAAYLLAAGGLGGRATVEGTGPGDVQGDRKIADILAASGCSVTTEGGAVTCSKTGIHRAVDVDFRDTPDLFPVVAAFLATAGGTSRLYGADHLRFKEADRIAATVEMINALGGDAEATGDGCTIRGVDRLRGGCVNARGDHRIFMAAAVASLSCDGPVVLDDDRCWDVSYPGFPEQMASLGVRVRRGRSPRARRGGPGARPRRTPSRGPSAWTFFLCLPPVFLSFPCSIAHL